LFLCGLTLAFLSWPSTVKAGCEKDTDCKGDRICVEGTCVSPGAQGCQKDTDCPGDEVCADGACKQPAREFPKFDPMGFEQDLVTQPGFAECLRGVESTNRTIEFVVERTGKTRGFKLTGPLEGTDAEACLRGVVAKLQFAPLSGSGWGVQMVKRGKKRTTKSWRVD